MSWKTRGFEKKPIGEQAFPPFLPQAPLYVLTRFSRRYPLYIRGSSNTYQMPRTSKYFYIQHGRRAFAIGISRDLSQLSMTSRQNNGTAAMLVYRTTPVGFEHFSLFQYLTNKEASTVFCSIVKHTGSSRARKKCRGKHKRKSSVFPYFLSVLPLPKCFPTEQSTVDASLFIKY